MNVETILNEQQHLILTEVDVISEQFVISSGVTPSFSFLSFSH